MNSPSRPLLSVCYVAGDKERQRNTAVALPVQWDNIEGVVEFLPYTDLGDRRGLPPAALAEKWPTISGQYTVFLDAGVEPLSSWQELATELRGLDTREPAWAVAIGRIEARGMTALAVVLRTAHPLPRFSHTGNLRELALQFCAIAARLGYGSHSLNCEWKRNKDSIFSHWAACAQTDREAQRIREYQEKDHAPTTCTVLYWGSSVWRRAWSIARSQVILKDEHYLEAQDLLAQRAGRLAALVRLMVPFLKRIDDLHWWSSNWRTRCGF